MLPHEFNVISLVLHFCVLFADLGASGLFFERWKYFREF